MGTDDSLEANRGPRRIKFYTFAIPKQQFDEIPEETAGGFPLDCEWLWLLVLHNGEDGIQLRAVNLDARTAVNLTNNSGRKISGRLDRDRVVYSDNRSGSYRVYLADLTTGTEIALTEGAGNQSYADIEGDWVAWIDDSHSAKDVWAMNLVNQERRCLTCDCPYANCW